MKETKDTNSMKSHCRPRPPGASSSTSAEPLLLQFKRQACNSTMRCSRANTLTGQTLPFIDIGEVGSTTIFRHVDSREWWAKITHSEELGVDVLEAPSLGLLQIPLSTYLDDMTPLFPGSRGAFSMRTRYGCQKWFRIPSQQDGVPTLRASYPTPNEGQTESLVSALTLVAQEVSTPQNQYQTPHFLPSDADPNLFAKWPFSFEITVAYNSKDDFALEILLSNLPSFPPLVREASVDLIHAAILAAFTINQTIWMHQDP